MKNLNLKANPNRQRWGAFGAFAVIAVVLAGCGKSADEYVSRAQALRDKGDIPAAVIELKNALQKDPKNLVARILLGQTYLDLSDPVNAETDLLRARADGAASALLAKPLAETELQLGKFGNALTESEIPPDAAPALKASLYSIRGLALGAQGKSVAADDAFAAGLGQDPRSVDVLAAMVQYAVARHDLATARERLAQALDAAPTSTRVIALKGAVNFADQKFSEAEEAFLRVIKAQPWNVGARTDVAQAEIAQGKLKEADANLATVLRASPKAPRPNYLRALTAFQAHDYPTAQSRIEIVLSATSGNAPVLLLAGSISYALGQFEQANSYLGQYVNLVPQDARGRRLLGAVQMQLGHPADAVKTLSPALAASDNDAQILALIGEAAARSGDTLGAEKYLTQALEKQPGNAAVRTELGLTKISLGETGAAIEEFERAGKDDPNALGPDAALIGTYLKAKEYDKALAVAEGLQDRQATNPIGFDFAGIVQFVKGDREAAQAALLKAKDLRAEDPIALRGLAALAVLDGKLDVATGYYETLVRANPKDAQAAIALAQLQFSAAKPDAAGATLQKALEQDGDNSTIRAALARLLLVQNKPADALTLVRQALVKNPKAPELLEVAGLAQLATGGVEGALASFKALVDVTPQAGSAHRELAQAYSAAHENAAALAEARAAVKLAPEDKQAELTLGSLLVTTKNFDEARQLSDAWATASPQDSDLAELQGIIASAQDRTPDALAAFQRAVAMHDDGVYRARLALAQEKAGDTGAAEKTLTAWLATNPNDIAARTTLGDVDVRLRRFSEARDQYAEVVKLAPNDVAVENNLAWTLSLLGQTDEALQHARHAAAQAPNSPSVLDTLGVVLLEKGNAGEARDALEKAAKGAPDAASIQFHFAQALAQTDAKDKARDVLRSALATQAPFDERDQAQKLFKDLGG